MGMKQRNGKVKATVIENTKSHTLQTVLSNNVQQDTLLMTDELRGYNGIYHNFSTKHLQRYINEFTFKLNEGNCQIDTQDRMNSLFGICLVRVLLIGSWWNESYIFI